MDRDGDGQISFDELFEAMTIPQVSSLPKHSFDSRGGGGGSGNVMMDLEMVKCSMVSKVVRSSVFVGIS